MSSLQPGQDPAPVSVEAPAGAQTVVFGGGCFWCVEAIFEALNGVTAVESGYAGGSVRNPTYAQVCTGTTGHAEVVKVMFDPKVVSEDDLLHIFFTTHDPTTLNRQGPDSGTQYRSVVFYRTDEEKALVQKVVKDVEDAKIWPSPIVTTVEKLDAFYPAETYHQDYFDKFEKADPVGQSEMNAGYCRAVIEPKVRKFREKYAAKLKKR
ncbi:MAG: peptide-methionine (S)-S-oxide reductase MsrA [Armatimonadetes bacterium]|nr:peptide-methionine (S)-S-oxide reductase MsrA [Armatimonadota bacterium]